MMADQNLLMGVLALQMEFISESQLISAMQHWVFNKSKPIVDILVELKFIDAEKREFLSSLARQFMEIHANDAAKSLASLSSMGTVKSRLRALEDDDVTFSIDRASELRNASEMEVAHRSTISHQASSEHGNDRFRILRPHAKGGLGQVSVAEDIELHREVALKEMQTQYAADHDSRTRFMVEAEVTGQLEHPGIVPVYSLGKTKTGCPFYVMRFIRGDSLKEAIDRLYESRKQISADAFRTAQRRLVRRLVDVCNAIEYAHSRGVLHRDLKPGNIMLGKYGETLVVDWGLAKTGKKSGPHQTSEEQTCIPLSGDSSTETRMGTVVGTVSYMSPEQAEGRVDSLGPASDVYGLGATLYYLLTNRSPIEKLPQEEMLRKVRTGEIKRPRDWEPGVSRPLEAICQKAMSLRAADRYPTTAAMAEDLECWLADEPVGAYREPLSDRLARFVRKRRMLFTTTAAILLTSVVGLAIVNGLVRRQNAELKIARDNAERRRKEAEEERQKAEVSRKNAVREKERAEENLATARRLSVTLLSTAEESLTKPGINGAMIQDLRRKLTEEAFANFQKIASLNSGNPDVSNEFAKVARIASNLKRFDRNFAAASERLELSLKLQREIAPEKRSMQQRDYFAESLRDLGTLRKAEGKLPEAETALQEAFSTAEALVTAKPDESLYQRTKATIELEQIGVFSEKMDLEGALEKTASCEKAFLTLRGSDKAVPNDDFLYLFAAARKIQLLHKLGRHLVAKEAATAAIPIAKALKDKRPEDGNIALPYARMLFWSAEGMLEAEGVSEETNARIDQALEILEGLTKKNSASLGHSYALGEAQRVSAINFRKQMKYAEAEAALVSAQSRLENLLKASSTGDNHHVLAKTIVEFAALRKSTGDLAGAIELLKRAQALESEACKLSPHSVEMKRFAERIGEELRASERE